MSTLTPSAEEEFVLLICSRSADRDALRQIFDNSHWVSLNAWTATDSLRLLERSYCGIPVVICDYASRECDWKVLLKEFERMAVPPRLIVFSDVTNARLRAEVLATGAFSLLTADPFDQDEVLATLRRASFARTDPAGRTPIPLDACSSAASRSAR